MQIEELRRILDGDVNRFTVDYADPVLAQKNWESIGRSGMALQQLASLMAQVEACKQENSDPDMALNNLEKFVSASRSPLALGAMFERDPTAIPILMRIFSFSQYLSDLLIRDTEAYDSLRLTEGQLYARDVLASELIDEISNAKETKQAMQMLRRFKHRETLRIAFGDLIVEHRFEQVVEQISFLAESIIDAALHFARASLVEKWGQPLNRDETPCRFVIFALGKLGGKELNYSSDIDLIAVFESDGKTANSKRSNQELFQRVTREMIKLINEVTSLGAAYRVDMRLRPEGSRGPVCCSSRAFLQYYDLQGRNWERQALIKARAVAGDIEFGEALMKRLEQWVYRPILNRIDIGEIKALKRKIEHRTLVSGEETSNVKTGHGGIRDIEFAIQFLQLLNGGILQDVRTPNTLEAIRQLAIADCLSQQEAKLLSHNYRWLRQLEHLLQIMFDLQTHTLPEDEAELSKIAVRMGYRDFRGSFALQQFRRDLTEVTDVNNRILDHLLHNAFETKGESGKDEPSYNAVDLVLEPDLDLETATKILGRFRISDAANGRRMIENLGQESSQFLSSYRARHFFAAIVNELLERVSKTPAPNATLVSLSSVAEAIGGKGALWELFSFNPPSLELFVRLCASSDYLTSIAKRNPGMIDELIDSLLLTHLPAIDWLRWNLDELTVGAQDPSLILHSFKNVHHLRAGIRDIVGKDSVQETHRFLSDVAEVCLEKVTEFQFQTCARKHARRSIDEKIAERNGLVILALGKLGGREPNYHSDLDVVFLYDSTESQNLWMETSPQHFYSELATRITKVVATTGPNGKLFDLDSRLRPTGRSGALAVSLNEFRRYFESGEGQLWERLALCKSRFVFGRSDLAALVKEQVKQVLIGANWQDSMISEIRDMRLKMQENCRPQNLKRGVGGTVDVEFIAQMHQLKFAASHPQVLVSGTVEALDQLIAIGAIDREHAVYLIESYLFLRGVESRLRLMNTVARHDMPEGADLEKLAYLLRMDSGKLVDQVANYRARNRAVFDTLFPSEK